MRILKTPDDAAAHVPWFAHFAAMNLPASSQPTQAQLGWRPTRPGLLADLAQPHDAAAVSA